MCLVTGRRERNEFQEVGKKKCHTDLPFLLDKIWLEATIPRPTYNKRFSYF